VLLPTRNIRINSLYATPREASSAIAIRDHNGRPPRDGRSNAISRALSDVMFIRISLVEESSGGSEDRHRRTVRGLQLLARASHSTVTPGRSAGNGRGMVL